MKLDQDIGELFRDAFDGFEADVQGNSWGGIEQQLQDKGLQTAGNSAAGASTGSAGSSLLSLPVVAIGSALIGAGVIWFAFSGDDTPTIADHNPPVEINEGVAVVDSPDKATHIIETINTSEAIDRRDNELGEELQDTNYGEKVKADKEKHTPEKDVIPLIDESEATPFRNVGGSAADGWTSTDYNGSDPDAVVNSPVDAGNDNTEATEQAIPVTPVEVAEEADGTFTIQGSEAPVASINTSTKGGFAPLEVQFGNEVEYADGYRYTWSFDDNKPNSAATNPVHTFEDAGLYEVALTIESPSGKTSRNTVLIEVDEGSSFSHKPVPNVFSPNGDRINDEFIVPGVEARNLTFIEIEIYDMRNSALVFRSNDLVKGWDGNSQTTGQPAPVGVYAYIISAVGIDGKKYRVKGSVTLKR